MEPVKVVNFSPNGFSLFYKIKENVSIGPLRSNIFLDLFLTCILKSTWKIFTDPRFGFENVKSSN